MDQHAMDNRPLHLTHIHKYPDRNHCNNSGALPPQGRVRATLWRTAVLQQYLAWSPFSGDLRTIVRQVAQSLSQARLAGNGGGLAGTHTAWYASCLLPSHTDINYSRIFQTIGLLTNVDGLDSGLLLLPKEQAAQVGIDPTKHAYWNDPEQGLVGHPVRLEATHQLHCLVRDPRLLCCRG